MRTVAAEHNARMASQPNNPVTYFAQTNARQPYRTFGMKRQDRLSHMYVIGRTGTGKSTLLQTLIEQDVHNGEGLAFVDPHGDTVEQVVRRMPERRRKDVIYFNVADPQLGFSYNPLRRVSEQKRPLLASGLLEVFHKIWGERAWGQRMEHILRSALLAMLDQPEATLPDIVRLLRDDHFRRRVIENIAHQPVRDFWQYEYSKFSLRYRNDMIAPIVNKIGAFLSDPKLYTILTEQKQPLHFRPIMDEGKILLVNLAKGRIGEDSAGLLGAMLVTTLGLAAFTRQELAPSAREDFWCYLDEFQSFTTLSVANMLSELRKYHFGMIVAHQYLHQLHDDVRHAVLGNTGTLISFRLGAKDASFIAREFAPTFDTIDLLNLPNYDIYVKLMIDGAPSRPFSAVTLTAAEALARFHAPLTPSPPQDQQDRGQEDVSPSQKW